MPYITKEDRMVLDYAVGNLLDTLSVTHHPGFLNYAITRLLLAYLPQIPGYSNYNEVIGVLECVKQEFYSRAIRPYEDDKIIANGDVYSEKE